MKKALKNILFIITSMLFSFFIAYFFFFEDAPSFLRALAVIGMLTIPPLVGFITAVIFLITNRYLLKNHEDKKKFYLIRILVYTLIFTLVCFAMFIPDLVHDIKYYFKLV